MDRLQQLMRAIGQQLSAMSASQKLLIGSLSVILVMTLFVVSQYTSVPTLMPLMDGAEPSQQERAVTFLRTNGIPYELDETGRVMVEPGRVHGIIARMSEEGELPNDTRLTFNSLIEQQSWTKTYQQNEQAQTVALQNELAMVIQRMGGIRSARVIVDAPKARMGQPHRAPTAVATVFPDGVLGQSTVDAIAHLVASSKAGLVVDRVRVIDGTNNRQYRARSDEDMAASTYRELQAQHEERTRDQIQDMLGSYIPGVIVTVRAQVDTTRRTAQTKRVFNEGDGSAAILSRERTEELEQTDAQQGGEPGVRSNVQEDVFGASGAGAQTTEGRGESEFAHQFGGVTETVTDLRGFATKLNAVVNIPRPYFVSLFEQRQGVADDGAGGDADAAGPSDQDLQPFIDQETARIRAEVEALIDTSVVDGGQEGEVVVSMIPTTPDFGLGAGGAPTGSASLLGLPMGSMTAPELVRTIVLGGLAVVSLALVVFTAFRANRKDDLPSATDLIGIPPELANEEDLVGEAMEADSALAGIELSDGELEQRKRAEQIASLVEEKPGEAASVIRQWMADGPPGSP